MDMYGPMSAQCEVGDSVGIAELGGQNFRQSHVKLKNSLAMMVYPRWKHRPEVSKVD